MGRRHVAHRTRSGISLLIGELKVAEKKVGFERRFTKCKRAGVWRHDQQAAKVPEACTNFRSMAQVEPTATMRVLGAEVHMQAGQELEFAQILAKAWAAFHLKAPLWRTI